MIVFLFFLLTLVISVVAVISSGRSSSHGAAEISRFSHGDGVTGMGAVPFVGYDSYSGGCDVSSGGNVSSCDAGGSGF